MSINATAITNKAIHVWIMLLLFLYPFEGPCQANASNECDPLRYGPAKSVQSLPENVCIPDGFIIDDYLRSSDLDQDNITDVLAVKYNRPEDRQKDGEKTYWAFYRRNESDTVFRPRFVLHNIVPPYIKDISWDYLAARPEVEKLFFDFPRRLLGHDLSFQMNGDSIKLSYKIDDTYGKSFIFIFSADNDNWLLSEVEYFLGELPMYWWQDDAFYYPLVEKLKVIETRSPRANISIDKFDLKEAFKYRDLEFEHLSYEHVDKIQKVTKTISSYDFSNCNFILPADWKY